MVKDISKNVVLVMLVLAIVLSVTGTWLVLESINDAGGRATVIGGDTGTGNVKLVIGAEPSSGAGESSGNANVRLTIK